MNDDNQILGIINFDFRHVYPHVFWVSNWISDNAYPDGVAYKILSVRNELLDKAELVLVRFFRDGGKEVLHRAHIPLKEVKEAAHFIINGLSKEFHLDFLEQDFHTARTLDDFHALTSKYGWKMNPI
ncbi:MAG TPA: hypothetical protein VK811_08925 [Candidatus Acidoferrum sp.]|nr:hypothetical protein [Candidatus Acidoferrum sp.]